MTGQSELIENWCNKTYCFALPCAKILLKSVEIEKVTSNQNWVHLHVKPEIRIFLRKRLVRKLGKSDLAEFFTQHLEHIDASSVKISCNLVERLTRYKQKKKGAVFFASPCSTDIVLKATR